MELSVTKLFKKNLVDIKKMKMINFGKDSTTDIDGKLSCLRANCSKRRKPNSGDGNLYTHIISHDDWLDFYNDSCNAVESGPIDSFLEKYHPFTESVFGWLKFIVDTNQPFNCVANKNYRDFSKHDGICISTEKKYFDLVLEIVFTRLSKLIPKLFGIIFDGIY
jgi:hypothetical protein